MSMFGYVCFLNFEFASSNSIERLCDELLLFSKPKNMFCLLLIYLNFIRFMSNNYEEALRKYQLFILK